MELRHLRYFVGVAEEENVSRASLKLHVSQPALSRQIRDLEGELGFELLERSAKSVRLTPAGHAFLIEARAVLQRLEEGVSAARQIAQNEQGEVHVGYAPSLTARLLPSALRRFQTGVPGVHVKLHDLSTGEMLEGARERRLDVALLALPMPSMLRGLQFEKLLSESWCVAVASSHPLARQRVASVQEVAKLPLIGFSRVGYPEYHEFLARLFAVAGGKPRLVEEHDSVSSLIAGVESGGGVAMVTASLSCVAGARLTMIPLSPAPQPLDVGAVWRKGGLSDAAEAFLRCAREAAGTLKGNEPGDGGH